MWAFSAAVIEAVPHCGPNMAPSLQKLLCAPLQDPAAWLQRWRGPPRRGCSAGLGSQQRLVAPGPGSFLDQGPQGIPCLGRWILTLLDHQGAHCIHFLTCEKLCRDLFHLGKYLLNRCSHCPVSFPPADVCHLSIS